jgi:hypothetical protein
MITSLKIFENNIHRELYHFTSLLNAISIADSNEMFSYYGRISTTRNKYLNRKKPPGISLGVRIVFDWNKILEDYETKPFTYSKELTFEEEELISTKDFVNIKKYIISIDLILKDIQDTENIGIHDDDEMNSFQLIDSDCKEVEDIYYSGYYTKEGKWSSKFLDKCKEYFESKGLKVNMIKRENPHEI